MQNEIIVGDAVKTVVNTRAIGGRAHVLNTGTIERVTATLLIMRNEHGNIQRFKRDTWESVPRDALCPRHVTLSFANSNV
jgi:hypothetical protein